MALIQTVFVIMALICFLVGTINAQLPASRSINWVSAGLTLVLVAWLVGRS
jgi:uncharacterized membrane protein YGL010W